MTGLRVVCNNRNLDISAFVGTQLRSLLSEICSE
jgi:hypothetical protein